MEVGISIPNYDSEATPENLISIAKLADQLGYDSIWVCDHILPSRLFESPYHHIYEPLTVLSFLAPIAVHVKLGTSILLLPLRNPALVAKTVASLDSLSGGRVILGVGVGGGEDDVLEFAHVGSSFTDRGKKTNEYIRAIKELWASSNPEFQGSYVRFADVVASPKPAQQGGPPIWIGGRSDAALTRAATLGDGWHPNYMSVEELEPRILKLKSMNILSNRFTISVRERVRIVSPGESPPKDAPSSIVGSQSRVAETVSSFSKIGVDHFVCVPLAKGREDLEEQVRRFGEIISIV